MQYLITKYTKTDLDLKALVSMHLNLTSNWLICAPMPNPNLRFVAHLSACWAHGKLIDAAELEGKVLEAWRRILREEHLLNNLNCE